MADQRDFLILCVTSYEPKYNLKPFLFRKEKSPNQLRTERQEPRHLRPPRTARRRTQLHQQRPGAEEGMLRLRRLPLQEVNYYANDLSWT